MLKKTNKKLVSVYPGNTTTQLNEDNPYAQIPCTDTDAFEDTDGIVVSQIFIPDDLLQRALELEKYNCTARFILIIDIIMSSLYFLSGWLLGGICLIASVNGYMATVYYKKSLLICYLVYQYLQVSARFVMCMFIATEPQYIGFNDTSYQSKEEQEAYALTIGLNFLYFVCQVCIASFITRYYKLLPTNEERTRIKSYLPS